MTDAPHADQEAEIADALREAAAFRLTGRATINDIARIAKVSKKTVSRVINESPLVKPRTRHLVKVIIAELGFTPDPQARVTSRTRTVNRSLVTSRQFVVVFP